MKNTIFGLWFFFNNFFSTIVVNTKLIPLFKLFKYASIVIFSKKIEFVLDLKFRIEIFGWLSQNRPSRDLTEYHSTDDGSCRTLYSFES